MTPTSLNALTRKELAQKAKRKGIEGWHGMRKQELVDALMTVGKKRAGRNGTNGHHARREEARRRRDDFSNTVLHAEPAASARDSLAVEVMDHHWVQLTWNLTHRMVERAETSLGTDWHDAVPVVRVLDVTTEDTGSEKSRHVKDVDVAGGSEKWFVPVDDPSRTYRFHIGFRGPSGAFFSLAHSRKVVLPRPSASSRLERPGSVSRKSGRMPIPSATNGNGRVPFVVEAELVVHGSTHPSARLSILGQPVELDDEGHFAIRVTLPEGRQVIPTVSVAPGGDEQNTIVLAVERNTKTLEPESLVET